MKFLKILWPLMLVTILLYGHFTKLPYTFILISLFILAFTVISRNGLESIGFRKFGRKEALITIAAFLIVEGSMDLLIQPLLSKVLGEPADYSSFEFIEGDASAYIKWLLLMWISAAFGEELLFRAFIIERVKKLRINNVFIQILLSAIAFSLPHLYQGTTGLIVTFLFGCAFAWQYIRYQNLWINVLVHGLTDTLFLTLSYYGYLSFYNS